jgi:hypothetical protein
MKKLLCLVFCLFGLREMHEAASAQKSGVETGFRPSALCFFKAVFNVKDEKMKE